ncbi:MAG TPA: threonine/serine dehydratase, partial [Caulobacteraceae bacterium]
MAAAASVKSGFDLDDVRAVRAAIDPWIVRTPTHPWRGPEIAAAAGPDVDVQIKLELFQHTGSFKPRGALNVIRGLTDEQRSRGVTAVSAGNHAIATAYAAARLGASAKVVMMASASPVRVARSQAFGAEVVLAEDVKAAFATAERIAAEEGRFFVHPYEGPATALGTATVALELSEQVGPLDAVVIPIGGGGLCAGMASAIKQLQPKCAVFGVEPEGADSMHRSFAAGEPRAIEQVRTIADSLGAPMALPYSFDLCRRNVDELVMISDDELRRAMKLLFDEMKLAVEPA